MDMQLMRKISAIINDVQIGIMYTEKSSMSYGSILKRVWVVSLLLQNHGNDTVFLKIHAVISFKNTRKNDFRIST